MNLIQGDCIEVLAKLDADSIDAIVTDPPYGLGFMGKDWDGVPPGDEFARQALRVLKPGGHLLAFGGTRTYHRLVVALEDAGFEIRDCIAWMYGTGFPKSLDVSKAIDKAAGAEREVIGVRDTVTGSDKLSNTFMASPRLMDVTAPATDSAKQWQGWGTALKPAFEPIVVARKPLAEKTVAANVQRYGTGALNIDGTRIDGAPRTTHKNGNRQGTAPQPMSWGTETAHAVEGAAGRWPANVTLDEEAAAMLDEQSGERPGATSNSDSGADSRTTYAKGWSGRDKAPGYADTGGASRFFYVAKASRKERREGNDHPTVKPVELMRWLVRLVTPPGGRVIDPFMGSGTTGLAAMLEGFEFVGIERDAHYCEIARARLADLPDEPMQETLLG